jgi:hypothetical protein
MKPARVAFDKAVARGVPAETIIAGAVRYAAEQAATGKAHTQWTAHPLTWLNQERWNDEPAQVATSGAVQLARAGGRPTLDQRLAFRNRIDGRRRRKQHRRDCRRHGRQGGDR